MQLVGGGKKRCRGRQLFVTTEDEIAMVHGLAPCYEEFQFSKLNQRQGEIKWSPLTES